MSPELKKIAGKFILGIGIIGSVAGCTSPGPSTSKETIPDNSASSSIPSGALLKAEASCVQAHQYGVRELPPHVDIRVQYLDPIKREGVWLGIEDLIAKAKLFPLFQGGGRNSFKADFHSRILIKTNFLEEVIVFVNGGEYEVGVYEMNHPTNLGIKESDQERASLTPAKPNASDLLTKVKFKVNCPT